MIDEDEDDLSSTIAAAIEEREGAGIIDDLGRLSDDAPDSPEPETDESEAGTPVDDSEVADPPVAHQETDTGPDRDPEAIDALGSAVSPYQAYLASKGLTAPQAVQVLLAAEHQLSTGAPEQKAKILARLAKDYGVELDALYDFEEAAPANPEIAQLQQRQAQLERMVNGERQQVAAQMRQEVEGQVTAFAGEKDAAGNLAHPHLSKVQVAMGHAIEQNPELTLEQAYENAVWGDPSLRKEAIAKRRSTPTGKSAKAKASAKPAKGLSLRDQLTRDYRRLAERASA